jgi:hypothetical protein
MMIQIDQDVLITGNCGDKGGTRLENGVRSVWLSFLPLSCLKAVTVFSLSVLPSDLSMSELPRKESPACC